MIAYQLASGKTIFIDSIVLLTMSDDDLQNLEAKDSGFMINDPFFDIRPQPFSEEEDSTVEELFILETPELEIEKIDFDEDD